MSQTKLLRLSEAQQAAMPGWADRWIAEGLRTDEADWEQFEAAARRCYEFANLSPPKVVVRVESPLVLALAAPIAAWIITKQAGDKDSAVRSAVGSAVDLDWYRYIGGQFWHSWQAYTSFFRDVCQLNLAGDLWERDRAYARANTAACWWWPHTHFVMVCNRPRVINLDEQGRLHSDTGPAIQFRDGWGIWASHDVHVTQQTIESPASLSIRQITEEPNAEVRRVMLERFGQERYIRESGAELLHRDGYGTLWRADLQGDEPLLVVEALNSTPEPDGTFRNYWLRVPSSVRTAHEAVAWTFEMGTDEYQLAAQT